MGSGLAVHYSVLVICLGLCMTRSAGDGWVCSHTIHTDCSVDGSLSLALGEAQAVKRSVCIVLSNGNCSLNSPTNATLSHMTFLKFVGAEKNVIRCSLGNNVGLSFLNSSNIMFFNVTFTNCGTQHNSTSRNVSAEILEYLLTSSALFFLFCSNVSMTNVNVNHSVGSGLVMYNTLGLNTFTSCRFYHSESLLGTSGSGVVIDFSYCVPGNTHCSEPIKSANSHYVFTQSQFMNNNATTAEQEPLYPHGSDHMTFGKGGGVSISFGGQSIQNTVEFHDCTFAYNQANVGIGLYVYFGDVSINNTLIVKSSTVAANNPSYFGDMVKNCSKFSGGGAKIDFIYFPPDPLLWPGYVTKVEGNKVNFTDSQFIGNTACYGGAVSVQTSRDPNGINSNHLSFDSCEFIKNRGQLSSAVDLSVPYPDLVGQPGLPIEPLFLDCTFNGNRISMGDIRHYSLGMGALYTSRVPIRLAGHNRFVGNNETALVVLSTYVNATESSLTEFTENKGRLGGAAAFIGNAWLIVHDNSSFYFGNNLAYPGGLGGAIYSAHFWEHDFKRNCFFQYYKPTIAPSNWPVNFTFINNIADGTPNSIYTTSVEPCKWPASSGSPSDSSQNVFCGGHPWHFIDSNCSDQVMTAASTLEVPPLHIQVVPGWPTELNITAVDDYGRDIPSVLVAYPNVNDIDNIKVSNTTRYISNDEIVLHGIENQTISTPLLMLRTLDPRVIVSKLGAAILSCPPGFISHPCADQPSMTCDCKCPTVAVGLSCDEQSHTATLKPHYCLTYQYDKDNVTPNKSLPIVLGKCPFNTKNLTLPTIADDLDDVVCGPTKRTGLLCSTCRENYGVAINSYYECVPCNPSTGWLLFLAVKILPVTLFFMVIAMVNIRATAPGLNAFVFYGQIVSLSYFYNPYPFFFGILSQNKSTRTVLIALVEFVYGFLNLDFFRSLVPPFCVGHIGAVGAIAINFVVSLYPFLLVLLLYVCKNQLYDRSRCVKKMWDPFKQCLDKLHPKKKPTNYMVDAFTNFFLFSYTNFLCVSIPLLQPMTVFNARLADYASISGWGPKFFFDATLDSFGSPLHALLLVLVVIIIVVFVVCPSLFLVLYPLKCMQDCISKLPRNDAIKAFADRVTVYFKSRTEKSWARERRYFAGLYFIFRIAFLTVFIVPLNWLEQYLIQQVLLTLLVLLFAVARPYEKDRYNIVDMSMFALLALQNALSFYNSQKSVLSLPVFYINYILTFLPLLYLITIAMYSMLGCLSSKCYKNENSLSESTNIIAEGSPDNSYKDGRCFPDRVENPDDYLQHSPAPHITITKPTNERTGSNCPLEVSTENSHFLSRQQRRELQAYGSIQTD